MVQQFRPAIVLLLLFTLLTGLVYPLVLTGLGQMLMPHQANGSLIDEGGRVIGSELIGQNFAAPFYFHGRPSAAGTGYDAANSSGSNFGPASKALIDRSRDSVKAARADGLAGNVPVDMVTASASGLDPDISPGTAMAQVARVARVRGLAPAKVADLVQNNIDTPTLGIVGEPRVNVLALNRQLDRIAAQARR